MRKASQDPKSKACWSVYTWQFESNHSCSPCPRASRTINKYISASISSNPVAHGLLSFLAHAYPHSQSFHSSSAMAIYDCMIIVYTIYVPYSWRVNNNTATSDHPSSYNTVSASGSCINIIEHIPTAGNRSPIFLNIHQHLLNEPNLQYLKEPPPKKNTLHLEMFGLHRFQKKNIYCKTKHHI